MSDLDAALATTTPELVTATSTTTPRKCKRHQWAEERGHPATDEAGNVLAHGYLLSVRCVRCFTQRDDTRSRRGKQSRNYGNRAELDVARRYGGTKTGHHGGPVDVRGAEWNTQVKTHRRMPPVEWRSAFAKMEASSDRLPRLLLRFVMGPGTPPVDYIVVPGKAWLDWFGKDEEAA